MCFWRKSQAGHVSGCWQTQADRTEMRTGGLTDVHSGAHRSPAPRRPLPLALSSCLPGWPGARSRWPAGPSPGQPPGPAQPGAPARCAARSPPAAPARPGPRSAARPRCAGLRPPPSSVRPSQAHSLRPESGSPSAHCRASLSEPLGGPWVWTWGEADQGGGPRGDSPLRPRWPGQGRRSGSGQAHSLPPQLLRAQESKARTQRARLTLLTRSHSPLQLPRP